MEKISIFENNERKIAVSSDYNYEFNKKNGYFVRWGKSLKDDPVKAPINEILDIEVTTSCKYVCPWCYKSNNPSGKNMSFETFKNIFDKMNKYKILTQIAFGVDAYAESNPDLWKMMEYSRENGVIPNITVAQLSDDVADLIAKYCGAVAVSQYDNKNICYDTVKKLTDRGMKQVNIHKLVCAEKFSQAEELIDDIKTDERLKDMNAIVFLSLKQKGRGIHFNKVTDEQFLRLIRKSIKNGIRFGFDSCSAPKFLKCAKILNVYEKYVNFAEPCESSLFSAYINVDGLFFPCSFSENTEGWEEGIDVVGCDDFINDVWNHEKTIAFRNKLLHNCDENKCRNCPLYNV